MKTETVVLYFSDNSEKEFIIEHNLEDYGHTLYAAATHWASRRNNENLTPQNLCDYIVHNQSGLVARPAMEVIPKTNSKETKLFESRDPMGNVLYKEVFKNGNYKLSLKLIKENRVRALGMVDVTTGTFYMERKRGKHVLLKTDSYGINGVALDQPEVKSICITDEKGTFLLTKETVYENGKYLFFKQTGYEKQIFVPLTIIEKFETH